MPTRTYLGLSSPGRLLVRSLSVAVALLNDFMSTAAAELQVELEDDEIVVTKWGTRYLLAYRKSVDQPRLVMTRRWMGSSASPAKSEFRAQAFKATVDKARELGWIV